MIKEAIEFMMPGLPGDLQTLWVGEKLRPFVSDVFFCKGRIYSERTPPDLERVLFKKVAGVWVRPCTWLQVENDVYNFIIPEIYPEYSDIYVAVRTDGIFRHIPDSRGLIEVSEDVITMIKSNYGI